MKSSDEINLKTPATTNQILAKVWFARMFYTAAVIGLIWPNITSPIFISGVVFYMGISMVAKSIPIGFYVWLQPENCGELAELCKKHTEIDKYRKMVINLNRRFTIQEFYMLQEYNNRCEELKHNKLKEKVYKEDCKELYLIKDPE